MPRTGIELLRSPCDRGMEAAVCVGMIVSAKARGVMENVIMGMALGRTGF
jgi:hypothetical protein